MQNARILRTAVIITT